MKKRLLYLDNNQPFRDGICRLLGKYQFLVTGVETQEEALAHLDDSPYHMLLCDIRLESDDDPLDRSGLYFIRDEQVSDLPKLVVTAYLSGENAGHAVGYAQGIIEKEDPKKLVSKVQEIYAEHVKVNWDLEIQLGDDVGDLRVAVRKLFPDGTAEQVETGLEELEFLLMGAFFSAEAVKVERILWVTTGRLAMLVHVMSPGRQSEPRILICGFRDLLGEEKRKIREHLPQLGSFTHRGPEKFSTNRLSVFTYVTTGKHSDQLQPWSLLLPYVSLERSHGIIDFLFETVLPPWHGAATPSQPKSMAAWFYSLADRIIQPTDLERVIDELVPLLGGDGFQITPTVGSLFFKALKLERSYCHPAKIMRDKIDLETTFLNSPGSLSARNILCDGKQDSWLTQFDRCGPAPEAHDFAAVELILRFCRTSVDSWAPIFKMEEELNEVFLSDKRIRNLPDDLKKARELILKVRTFANDKQVDERGYYLCSYFLLVQSLFDLDPRSIKTTAEKNKVRHQLLSLAMISERLLGVGASLEHVAQVSEPEQRFSIALDKARRMVDLNGGTIKLSTKRFKVFSYLYEHLGEDCNRQDLGNLVWSKYDAQNRRDINNLNALVSRIREQLEEDPTNPKLIITVDNGYRLIL